MKNKYKSLISHLEGLSKELEEVYISPDYSNIIEVDKYELKSQQISINEYSVEIFFKREGYVFYNLDIFKIIDENETFIVDYTRRSKHLLPMMTKLLPDVVNKKWRFNYSLNQELIFKQLLKSINTMFTQKYNYFDKDYERKYKY